MHALKQFKIMFWNAQGITNACKRIHIENFIISNNIDIVLLAETFLKPTQDFKLQNYVVYRNDRLQQARGGVAIILRKSLSHKLRAPINTKGIENLSIDINIDNSPTCISVAYSPKYTKHFSSDVQAIYGQSNQYLIFGDFNARHSSWNCVTNNQAGFVLNNLQQNHPFMVFNTAEHTHFPHSGQTPSTIDLLLTNTSTAFDLSTHQNHMSSDHAPIIFHAQAVLVEQQTKIYDYHKADWMKYRHFINTNIGLMPNITSPADIDLQIERFSKLLLRARRTSIPEKTFRGGFALSQQIRQIIQHKNSIKRRWQRASGLLKSSLKSELNSLQKYINKAVVKEHNEYWSTQLRGLSKGNKKLWQLTKRFKGKLDSNVDKITVGNLQSIDDADRADSLADVFEKAHSLTSSYLHENDIKVRNTINAFRSFSNLSTSAPKITLQEIEEIIATFRPFKAPGPDSIQNVMLKQLPRSAIIRLCEIFNECLATGYWPINFKLAKVIPILKAGKSPRDVNNYRPISLLNSTGKILERAIYNRLNVIVDQKNLLPNYQFGFRKGHSTIHQALRIKQFIINQRNCNRSTGMLLLDIEKAFDSIWHDGLIFKLIKMKLPSYMLKMIDSFIRRRKFSVHVNHSKSKEIHIPAGLAQGTCISPVLYALFVADMPPQSHDNQIALYADDTAIYTSAKQSNTIIRRLNEAFGSLRQYFHKWKVKINSTKTQAIIFPFNNSRRRAPSIVLKNDNHVVELSKSVKYLGVIFDHKLNFAEHISCTVDKANRCFRAIYPLIAAKSHLSTQNKNLIFRALIRPVMAYGSPIWSSAAATHIKKLVVFQKKILKTIYKLPRRTTSSILENLSEIPHFDKYITNYNLKFKNNSAASNFELIRITSI